MHWDECTATLMGEGGGGALTAADKRSRRLYDVANVLCATRLVAKSESSNNRRPSYTFLGAESVKAHFAQATEGRFRNPKPRSSSSIQPLNSSFRGGGQPQPWRQPLP